MTAEKFNQIVHGQIAYCGAVLESKGAEYTFGEDRLEHFKTTGADQGIDPKQALWGMVAKHTTSLAGMFKNDGREYSKDVWREKITDTINYMFLLWALVYEETEGEN